MIAPGLRSGTARLRQVWGTLFGAVVPERPSDLDERLRFIAVVAERRMLADPELGFTALSLDEIRAVAARLTFARYCHETGRLTEQPAAEVQ